MIWINEIDLYVFYKSVPKIFGEFIIIRDNFYISPIGVKKNYEKIKNL